MPIQGQPIPWMRMSADDHEEAPAEAEDLLELIRARLTVLGD